MSSHSLSLQPHQPSFLAIMWEKVVGQFRYWAYQRQRRRHDRNRYF
jgi:hypothetical protein